MMRSAAFPLLALVALVGPSGCSDPAPRPAREGSAPPAAPGTLRQPGEDELRQLLELSELVVVGAVETELDEPGGVFYRVRVQEVLHEGATVRGAEDHPHQPGTVLRVSAFRFQQGGRGPGEIGALNELSRYLFFLSPTEKPGEWLNLDDAAGYPLPEAQPTLDALRARARPQVAPGQGGG